MRVRHVVAACVLFAFAIAPAAAEQRLFIIANNADGYGVDRCLAAGAPCGRAIAAAYCRAREFQTAVSYRKVERDDMTGAVAGENDRCKAGICDEFVAIECSR
jgi:hypothetical protein